MKINIPDNISLNIPERYILTIYVHPEKFSFLIHCPDDPQSYFFYKIDSTEKIDAFSVFKDLFFENDFFTYPFQKTCILVFSPLFTYVPHAIYSDEYKENFIKFIFSEKEEKFLNHSVPSAKLNIIYPVSGDIYDFFVRSFNEPEFIHYSASLITYFSSPAERRKNTRMVINSHAKGIDIFCFTKKSFLLGNHFPCEKSQDAVYYILYTWKQLKMNQFTDWLYLAGEHSQNEELFKELQLYIDHIQLNPLPEGYPFELSIFPL